MLTFKHSASVAVATASCMTFLKSLLTAPAYSENRNLNKFQPPMVPSKL